MSKLKSYFGELKSLYKTLDPKINISYQTIQRYNDLVVRINNELQEEDLTRFKIDDTYKTEFSPSYSWWNTTAILPQISSLIGYLEDRFTPTTSISNSNIPSIVVINQNTIGITINQTINNLIEKAQDKEEKSHLQELDAELKKPDKNWDKIKKILAWILEYSKDLSLQVLPIILKAYMPNSSN